jgi:hypothetical protein
MSKTPDIQGENMPDKKAKCFIIMPITTPETLVTVYRDGKNHFQHVLDCLFIPAIEKAGFEPKNPKVIGSDVIHAEIISTLETSDLVFCDMSSLNPNVFFEFGIRTSLNKPVCVVKDELTKQIPFDTGILNYETYDSSIDPWTLSTEIDKLVNHIKTTMEKSKGENALWRIFGFKFSAPPLKTENDTDSKLDFLSIQIDALRQQMANIPMNELKTSKQPELFAKSSNEKMRIKANMMTYILNVLHKNKSISEIEDIEILDSGIVIVSFNSKPNKTTMENLITGITEKFGVRPIIMSQAISKET